MIIPTAEFDPLFADDGVSFREKMADYIRREFSDVLGSNVALLRTRDGLDRMVAMYGDSRKIRSDQQSAA